MSQPSSASRSPRRGMLSIDAVETARSPAEAVAAIQRVLDVVPVPDEGEDVFAGTSYRPPWGRIFGGQVLAQSLVAAQRTVEESRPVHSLHAYFLRRGDPEVELRFAVERIHDGRSFAARRTHAMQNGVPILSMISSFQAPARGLDHQTPMPDVPQPEDLPSMDDLLAHVDIESVQTSLRSRPVDIRHVEGPLYLTPGRDRVAHQAVWLRTPAPLPDDPLVQVAFLTFASDYSLLESILRRHGLAWSNRNLRTASLDHAMWFHRPARLDEWMLYVQESPSASGARGLGTARLYTRDGVLAASVAQEGMLRVPEEDLPS